MNKSCNYSLRGLKCRVCKNGLHRYGLSRLDQIKLLESQNMKCKICDKEIKLFDNQRGAVIDHNHKTKKIRGILCNRCNIGVGYLETHSNIEKLLHYVNLNNSLASTKSP